MSKTDKTFKTDGRTYTLANTVPASEAVFGYYVPEQHLHVNPAWATTH